MAYTNVGGMQSSPMSGFGGPNHMNFLQQFQTPALMAPVTPSTPSGITVGRTGYDVAGNVIRPQGRPPVPGFETGEASTTNWWGEGGRLEGIGSIMDGLGSLAEIWGAIQGVKLGREQLAFAKSSYETNLANSTQTYNTSLENEINSNFSAREKAASPTMVDDYLSRHSL